MKLATSKRIATPLILSLIFLLLIFGLMAAIFSWPYKMIAVLLLLTGLSINAPFLIRDFPAYRSIKLALSALIILLLIVPGYSIIEPVFGSWSTWLEALFCCGLIILVSFIRHKY
ncbi:MAG TPA: hypothetical protein VH186_27340 [Chloroflexia bacterium]|nr:hypothetical protein [Chloroflexia bacterium]